MSLQTPRSKAWSKITAARSDRIAEKKSQLYRTLSKNNYPIPESVTIEEENGNSVSDQGFSAQETEELDQSDVPVYDEEAFAEALKDINSELESLRSLYNSRWFTDMRKSLEKNRNKKQSADVELHRSPVTTEQFPRKTTPNNELNVSQYRQITPAVQTTTASTPTALVPQRKPKNTTTLMPTTLTPQGQPPFNREVNETNRGNKILPPHQEKRIGDDMELNKKTVAKPENISALTEVHTGVVSNTPKEVVSMVNMISKIRQEENIDKMFHTDTQNKFSGGDNKPLVSNFTQMLCEMDKITNELSELQRFKDAIYAMNEEFEKTESEASKVSATLMMPQSHSSLNSSKVQSTLQRSSEKRSPRLSYSSTKINVQESNRKANIKMPHSEILYNSQIPNKYQINAQETNRKVNNIKMPHSEILYNSQMPNKYQINAQETNRKVNNIKMPHSEILYNSQIPNRIINTQTEKQKGPNTEFLNRRDTLDKKKVTINHNLQSVKQKPVVHSLLDNKKKTPRGYSEKALPLEVNPVKVDISATPVSKPSVTNKMSKKSSPKTCKPVAPKRSIK